MDEKVYIIKRNNDQDCYKIGRSKRIDKRIKSLQTANASKIIIEHIISTENAPKLEYELHRKFKEKRIHGEWYKLNQDDINWLKNLKSKNLTKSLYSVLCNGVIDIKGTICKNDILGIPIETFYQAQKYLYPLDLLGGKRDSIPIEKYIQNKHFVLPSKITWIEGSNHLQGLKTLFKLSYSNKYVHIGCLILEEQNKFIFHIITADENFKLEIYSIASYIKNKHTFLISRNFCYGEEFNKNINCKAILGVCSEQEVDNCTNRYLIKNILLQFMGINPYVVKKLKESSYLDIKSAQKAQNMFCGITKTVIRSLLQNILRQILILNSPKTHLIKINNLKEHNEYNHKANLYPEGNSFHFITNENKIAIHYLTGENTQEARKPVSLHFRRSHLRHLVNRITKVKETFVGNREYICNNRKIELLK